MEKVRAYYTPTFPVRVLGIGAFAKYNFKESTGVHSSGPTQTARGI